MGEDVTKKDQRRLLLEVGILGLLICGLIFSTFSDWKTVVNNKLQTKELTEEYTSLLEDGDSLESEVNKLQDDDYLARYAREKFFYSKDGELIIRIPEDDE